MSIDCPKGDITLHLEKGGSYLLELKYWSQEERRHTHSEKISGKWSYQNDELVLVGKSTLVYKRDSSELSIGQKSASIDSFEWVRGSTSTFADSFVLVEKKEVDTFFISAAKKPNIYIADLCNEPLLTKNAAQSLTCINSNPI